MAELIDVACDICGQKYRWGVERVGSATQCRECGTKFEVAEYMPPPEEGTDDGNPLPWIKGACVAALVIASVAGLGSLPFIRPSPAVAVAANNRQPNAAGFARPVAPRANGPAQPPVAPADVEARLKALREKMGSPGALGPAMPGPNLPDVKMPEAGRPGPEFSGRGRRGPRMPNLPRPGIPGAAPQFPLPPTDAPGQAPLEEVPIAGDGPQDTAKGTARATGVPPEISAWRITDDRGRPHIRLTGRGLKHTTKVQKLFGTALFEGKFSVISDTELELKPVGAPETRQMMIVVTTPDGVAVALADDVKTVDSRETLDRAAGPPPVCFVKKGGVLTTSFPTVVIVDAGGRANVSGITTVGIVKKGAVLETAIAPTLIAEEGAKVRLRSPAPRDNAPVAVITFCTLPVLSNGR